MSGVGILYPGHAAERDYDTLNELPGEPVFCVVHTTIGEDAHRADALLDMGSFARLSEGARKLRAHGVAAAMWACTSASFIYGWDGARRQVAEVEELLGVPVSSTSLAFVEAVRTLGASRVAVAATYPEDVARHFDAFLRDAGLEPVGLSSGGIVTAKEVGRLDRAETLALVAGGDQHDADVLLVPDTAMHTVELLGALEAAARKPVLTANQVTAWEGLRLAGREPVAEGLGALFAGRRPRERARACRRLWAGRAVAGRGRGTLSRDDRGPRWRAGGVLLHGPRDHARAGARERAALARA